MVANGESARFGANNDRACVRLAALPRLDWRQRATRLGRGGGEGVELIEDGKGSREAGALATAGLGAQQQHRGGWAKGPAVVKIGPQKRAFGQAVEGSGQQQPLAASLPRAWPRLAWAGGGNLCLLPPGAATGREPRRFPPFPWHWHWHNQCLLLTVRLHSKMERKAILAHSGRGCCHEAN